MAKAQKEQFEGQLRDLQKDISSLTQRLAVSTTVSSHRLPQSIRDDVTLQSSDLLEDINKSFTSINTRTTTEKGDRLAELMQEAHLAKKERDDAIYRLEQTKQELEDARKGVQEYARLKAAYEHLRQDLESVKVSLESSERIRKQQKELINLLQKSHSIAVASDSGSVLSFNSISTISRGGNHDGRALDVSTASFAAENREWLKSTAQGAAPSAGAPIAVGPVGSAAAEGARRRRSSNTSRVHPAPMPMPLHASSLVPSSSSSHHQQLQTTHSLPSSAAAANGRPPLGKAPAGTQPHVLRSNSVSMNASAATSSTNASAAKSRRSSTAANGAHSAGTGKTKKSRSKKSGAKATTVSTAGPNSHAYLPAGPMPSYEAILGKNTSLVPNRGAYDLLNASNLSGSASGSILDHHHVSFSGTDVAAQLHSARSASAASLAAPPSQYQYHYLPPPPASSLSHAPSMHLAGGEPARAAGRPPRYPSTSAPPLHQQSSPIPLYIPSPTTQYAMESPEQRMYSSATAGRGSSGQVVNQAPATAAKRSASGGAGSGKKRVTIVRRIPGSNGGGGSGGDAASHAASSSGAKPRSQSAPPTRSPSTFGGASRRL